MNILYITLNILALYFGILNYNNVGGQLIISGITNNSIVITTNNFKMPVYNPYISNDYKENDNFHIINPKKSNFPFLGDCILIPNPITGNLGSFSIGDIEIISGVSIIFWNYLNVRLNLNKRR